LKEQKLLSFLENVLGKSYLQKDKSDAKFYCPFCNHHKKKLEINLENQYYHCWVCNTRGRNLHTLLKRLNSPSSKHTQLNSILGIKDYDSSSNEKISELLTLPKEYKPMYRKSNSFEYKWAIKYLKDRGLTSAEILKYDIGFCSTGSYKGRVIIPSYDKFGELNYFVGRSYYKDSKFKYKNPKVSRNIIGFGMLVDYNFPVVLVEGVFDAISIRQNAIPLLGKTLSKELEKALLTFKPNIYICLDNDAIKDSIKLARKLIVNGLKVHIVEMPFGEDPSSLGYSKMWKLIKQAKPINELTLLAMSI
jgi:DNA primase